jgi:hypothetical protein
LGWEPAIDEDVTLVNCGEYRPDDKRGQDRISDERPVRQSVPQAL